MAPVRVLIVDDHAEIRKSLRRLLTSEGYEISGEVADGPEVMEAVRRLAPDVILMDLLMPGMSGLDAAREVLAEFPATRIVLMTSPDPDIEQAARQAGVRGIVWKGSGSFVDALGEILERGH